MPLVSVLMPVNIAGRYFNDAVDSILSQTLNDFELLIIEDNADEQTKLILDNLTDSRVRVVLNKNYSGITGALNTGLEEARGEYIARMDADDICIPDRLQVQLDWLESNECDLCGGGLQCVSSGYIKGKVFSYPSEAQDISFALMFGTAFAHATILVKRSVILQFRYDEVYPYAQDYDLWIRMEQGGVKMTNVPRILYFYRIHSAQVSHAKNLKQQQFAKNISDRYAKFYLPNSLYEYSKQIGHMHSSRYELDHFFCYAEQVLSLAESKGVSVQLRIEFLAKLAFRITPLKVSNFLAVRQYAQSKGLRFSFMVNLKLMGQAVFKIKHAGALHSKLKWMA